MGAVALVAAGAGAVAVLHSPLFSARHVTVRGARHTAVSLVLRTAGLTGSPPLIDLEPGRAAQRLETLPWVGRAEVVRQWPDSVTVEISERQPVAQTSSEDAGTWALVDETGRVLQWQAQQSPGLPVLAAPVRAGPAGTELGPAAAPGLEVAQAAQGALGEPVLQVTVEGETVTLRLPGDVEAIVGNADELGAKMAALRSVLAGVAPKGPEVVDVTVPGEPTVGTPPSPSSAG
jgi:cell division protein FtsQ